MTSENITSKNFINYSNKLTTKLNNTISNSVKNVIEKNINKPFNLIQIKDPDYKGADIIKFLSFLNCHGKIPNDLRIVSHNNIMTNLLNLLDINNNNSEEIYKNQNLWSILLQLDNKKINITRHGFSISNLYKESGEKMKQVQYQDPELSLYGILTALLHGNQIIENERNNELTSPPSRIYVSTLIRTWMTAICLYLPYFQKLNKINTIDDNFTLIVSPFIKEVDKSGIAVYFGVSKDNTPNEFNVQIDNILKFLNYLVKMSEHNYYYEYLQENLLNIKEYFENGNALVIINDNKKEKVYIILENEIFKKINVNNRYTNFFKLNNNSKNKEVMINNVHIFNGINKPNKEIIKNKIIKPCERFSKIYNNESCNIELKKNL